MPLLLWFTKQNDKEISNKVEGMHLRKDHIFISHYKKILSGLFEGFLRTMRVKTYFFFIISCFAFANSNVHSQEIITKKRTYNHFLEIGLGLNYHATRDEATSPLIYSGYQPAFHLQYFFTNNKWLGIIDENFSVGYLKTNHYSSNDNNRALSFNNELSFTALYKYKSYTKSNLYVGGEFLSLTNIRQNDKFNNANINYEAGICLAPSAMLEYRNSWKAGRLNLGLFSVKKRDRNFKMQYALSIPVFSALARPGYVTINDFVDENSQGFNSDNIGYITFNHMFLMKNRFNFYYQLHNNNMLKFNYNFIYYNYYKSLNAVKGFHSSFYVSIVFRFTNN
jgi:hypothetical protein